MTTPIKDVESLKITYEDIDTSVLLTNANRKLEELESIINQQTSEILAVKSENEQLKADIQYIKYEFDMKNRDLELVLV